MIRSRWSAIGAAVAVSLGAGGLSMVDAVKDDGERPTLTPITSCRLTDTRPGSKVGPRGAPLGTDDTYTITAHGDNGECTGIPTDAVALALNVTTVDATQPTFVTFWDDGTARTPRA